MNAAARGAIVAVVALALTGLTGPSLADGPDDLGPPSAPAARAWALRVAGTALEALDLGSATAQGGSGHSSATAAPMAVAGSSPLRASADANRPRSTVTPVAWNDPTGSGSAEGLYADAHATRTGSDARTGLAAASGTGFPIADQLLTWEQQEEMIGTWADTNQSIAEATAGAMNDLGPFWQLTALDPPSIEMMSGIGFIDALDARGVGTSVSANSAAGFATASAETTADTLDLFGGFVVVHGVRAIASAERTGDSVHRTATASVDAISVAGVDFEVGPEGLVLADNELASASQVGAANDILALLEATGLTIRSGSIEAVDPARASASALEIRWSLGDEFLTASIGYVEASAPAQPGTPLPPAPLPVAPAPPPTANAAVGTPEPIPGPVPATGPGELTAPGRQPETTFAVQGPARERLTAAVVRSVRTTYLILVTGALLGALLFPLTMGGRTARRPRPTLRRSR